MRTDILGPDMGLAASMARDNRIINPKMLNYLTSYSYKWPIIFELLFDSYVKV